MAAFGFITQDDRTRFEYDHEQGQLFFQLKADPPLELEMRIPPGCLGAADDMWAFQFFVSTFLVQVGKLVSGGDTKTQIACQRMLTQKESTINWICR